MISRLKDKSEDRVKLKFSEHRLNNKRFHDKYNQVMDSANNLKNNPNLILGKSKDVDDSN
ncbi:MAG: hypothetical protein U0451_00075 [Candidatus Saccharimonadales bacterium]